MCQTRPCQLCMKGYMHRRFKQLSQRLPNKSDARNPETPYFKPTWPIWFGRLDVNKRRRIQFKKTSRHKFQKPTEFMRFYSCFSLSLSLYLFVSLSVFLFSLCPSVTVSKVLRRSTSTRDCFPDSSQRLIHSTESFVCANSPVIELVSRIRTCPFYSGLFEYNVRVHYGRRVSQAHRRVHYGGGVWNRRNCKRRTTGGHHCVHRRAPANHLLHHRFLLAVQAWKPKTSMVKMT